MSRVPDPVWILSDGAAGNARQASALAQALVPDVAHEWIVTARPPWRWCAPRRWPGAETAFGAEFAAALARPPALAIGCGRQAALATRLLRARGSRVIQILDPRLDPRHWDAVVAPMHDAVRGDNVLRMHGSVHPVDAAWLARARAAAPDLGALPGPRTLLLLGGPARNVRIDAHWSRTVGATLQHWLARDGGSLLISGSRRTPRWLADAARALAPDAPGRRWFGPADGDNPYPAMLAWADRIVVSPDSVNMISEACATHAPVSVPIDAGVRGRHARFLDALLQRGRVQPLRDAEPAGDNATPLLELPRIAAELRVRLGL